MGFGKSPDTWRVRSDADVHYTTALAQNAIDLESLGSAAKGDSNRPPLGNAVITRITLWSVQNLAWDVMLFRSATSQPSADPDVDTMIDWVRFADTDGEQIAGAGLFRYAVTGLEFRYQNTENPPLIHVGLINRSATTKLAVGPGEVVIEFAGPVF